MYVVNESTKLFYMQRFITTGFRNQLHKKDKRSFEAKTADQMCRLDKSMKHTQQKL